MIEAGPMIRVEAPGDADQVRHVNILAFGQPAEATLVDALRSLPGAISLVAVEGGMVVGHILFTPVSIEPTPIAPAPMEPTPGCLPTRVPACGLGPMAVLPSHQRRGVGSMLVHAGLNRCRTAGYGIVVVVGHPQYYPRFGFVPGSTRGIRWEVPVPDEVFMVLELEPGALARDPGVVRYHPEFSKV